jgi:hypothetical protein
MRTIAALWVTVIAVLAAGSSARGRLPIRTVLVPGRSLDGVALGEAPARVQSELGPNYSTCSNCNETTWLFQYEGGEPPAIEVKFRSGAVSAVATLGSASGSPSIASPEKVYRGFRQRLCDSRPALSLYTRHAVTVVWRAGGFTLARPADHPCS